ncbi:MAG TPA: ankyrin repeat domain-containing protein [Acidobacteriaceae bacterium]
MPDVALFERISNGRTDLVFDYIAAGNAAISTDTNGVSLIQHCAYYGDVSAIRHLLTNGASLTALGGDLGLNAACFHGHWRLTQFLLEQGADPNYTDPNTGETPLHAALCTTERITHNRVMRVLLARGADPNRATKPGMETGGFMRDVRTRGETPLHRAAAFGDEEAIKALLEAGAKPDAKDANGDSPLGWASWHLRPDAILRLLLYGSFRIRPGRSSMREYLQGDPR